MATQSLISVDNVQQAYGDRVALRDVSLELRAGEVISLVGPNGAGKSTLLKLLGRLLRPDEGSVTFAPELQAAGRRNVVYVPQRSEIDWTLPASVLDLVLMGAYPDLPRWKRLGAAEHAAARQALEVVRMGQYADVQIGRLSGGQQQRVILARALVRPAEVYLLDEPFSGVDAPTEALFEEVILDLRAAGSLVALATHNLDCARDISDRVVLMNKRIIAAGTSHEVLTPMNIAVGFGDLTHLHIHGDEHHVAVHPVEDP